VARPARRPGNLPAEATSFIGRRRELATLRAKLAGGRLVCLVGPGGVGKTRLALRAAGDLARGFPGGVWLVELAEIRDPALVANAVLAALDLRDQAAADPASLLLSYLRDKRLLLLVDNCEHLLAAAAGLLAEVLRSAPGVKVIATSRQPLSLQGEFLVPVPPLDLPDALADEPLKTLRHNEAVALFGQRAAAATGDFELTEANAASVADVCRRLDGLPLAIELAAVRTRVLSVGQIRDRLTDRFLLLDGGGGGGDALPRQRTLATTIDWSHDLLTGDERALLRRLYVFAGRFTLDDVEQVCSGTLEVLSSLVDKSLVLRVGEDARQVACYRLHETMREYAAAKAREAGEAESLEQRCACYYRDWCRRTGARARYELVDWLGWMELEIDNVRGALQSCLARKDFQLGLDLAAVVGWYWITRATSEGVRWLDEMLAKAGDGPHPLAFFMRGFLAVLQSDPAAAVPWLERAATASGQAGYASLESQSLSMAAIAAHFGGHGSYAGRLLEAAEKIAATRQDDYPTKISVLQAHSLCGLLDGDLDRVNRAATLGTTLSHSTGDLYALAMMQANLGLAALIGGDLNRCRPLLVEALRIARRIDDRVAQYVLLDSLACHACGTGGFRLAARLLGAAETLQTGVGASVLPYLQPSATGARQSTITALGPAVFKAEFEAGQGLAREEALALALGEPAPISTLDAVPSVLGRRQAEVARLIADGLSNKQIAACLVISEHTVDSHIRNIMTKLGCRSRAQIAAWVASRNA
jgi:predicted ATPase/DNA-binding CsgD family transcriptional regulator